MSDTYLILKHEPSGPEFAARWVEVGTFEADYPMAALQQVVANECGEGEFLVIRQDYGFARMTVTARTEYDIEQDKAEVVA